MPLRQGIFQLRLLPCPGPRGAHRCPPRAACPAPAAGRGAPRSLARRQRPLWPAACSMGCHHRRMALQLRLSTCGGPLCTIETEVGLALRVAESEGERERGRARGWHHRHSALQLRVSTCGGPLCSIEAEVGLVLWAVEREREGEGGREGSGVGITGVWRCSSAYPRVGVPCAPSKPRLVLHSELPRGRDRERGGRAWGCHHRRMALQLRFSTCGGLLCTIEVEVGLPCSLGFPSPAFVPSPAAPSLPARQGRGGELPPQAQLSVLLKRLFLSLKSRCFTEH